MVRDKHKMIWSRSVELGCNLSAHPFFSLLKTVKARARSVRCELEPHVGEFDGANGASRSVAGNQLMIESLANDNRAAHLISLPLD